MPTDKPIQTKYPFSAIEEKWRKRWKDQKLFAAVDKPDHDNKFYMLEMFIYPSGDIHMGHFRNYIIGDAVTRYHMMKGKQVLHPFGWDAFGLPAERAAIKRGIHPSEWTMKNVEVSRSTLQQVGISYDWDREVTTCLPDYYRWTQWIFLRLFEKGLAYRSRGFVNWCPEDKTVLANEQVVDGRCERCGTLVEKKDQVQWNLKITDYADRLLDDLEKLAGWPENLKSMQRQWIGRSYGTEIDFIIEETGEKLSVFTTRPDTIYGVTYMALAPESEIIEKLNLEGENAARVQEYRAKALARTDIERAAVNNEKTGVFTGKYVINPFNGEKVQLWVADYVLAGYGTGAVMAVPAHDTRDFAFAEKYSIPKKIVIQNPDNNLALDSLDDAYVEQGPMANSGQFDGLSGKDAISRVTEHGQAGGFGRAKVNYKLKDWSISRQRYWGCPIPIIHCSKCGQVAVPDEDLPVLLPEVENYQPKGRSPLADIPEFMNVTCPRCGGEAQRDPDTMDTFICSSWYFLRYLDPKNDNAVFDSEKANSWMPIDLYVGGISHATGHLMYFRFFTKFLHDIGLLNVEEPATRMYNHGMVMDAKGEMMSKSKGNVVSPIELMQQRGIDVSRMAMFFTAPSDKEVIWSDDTVTGVEKFILNRFFPLHESFRHVQPDLKGYFKHEQLSTSEWDLYVRLNRTVAKVADSIERLQFNTAIAALMELVRDYDSTSIESDEFNDYLLLKSVQLISPMAPHLAEELWSQYGYNKSIFLSDWPIADVHAIVGDQVEIAVQINGKLRDTVTVSAGANQEVVERAVLDSQKVQSYTGQKEIIRKIYIPGRLLNIVVK